MRHVLLSECLPYIWSGVTPISAACLNGHEEAVELLLSQVYALETSGLLFWKAIMNTLKGGHVNLIPLLVHSFTGNRSKLVQRILYTASHFGRHEVVAMMVDASVDINERDLHCAELRSDLPLQLATFTSLNNFWIMVAIWKLLP